MAETDRVLLWLESAEQHLAVELDQHPLARMIRDVRRLIVERKAVLESQPLLEHRLANEMVHEPFDDRLLCEIVHEKDDYLAVIAWENEGGFCR